MAVRGRPPAARGVWAFDDPAWTPPTAVFIDTSVAVDALLPGSANHAACVQLFRSLAQAGSTLAYNDLLETELAEALFRVAILERFGRSRWPAARYDGRVRKRAGRLLDEGLRGWQEILTTVDAIAVEHVMAKDAVPSLMRQYGLGSYDAIHVESAIDLAVPHLATLDTGFACVPSARLALYTSRRKLPVMRQRRKQLAGG